MIYLYSGTPGSGKSLNTARLLYNRIKWNKPVVANFFFNVDIIKSKKKGIFKEFDNLELSPRVLKEFSINYFKDKKFKNIEGKILLVIDESQLLFNSRDWNMKGRADWLSFFSQHRKFGYDIILVAQFDKMLDRQIRSLVEYEYIHRKVNNYGFLGKVVSLFVGGNLFCCVKRWYPMRHKVGSEFFTYRKKYSDLYNSYKIFED